MSQELQVLQDASGFTGEQIASLNEMLKSSHIKHRKGPGGKTLSYVSGDYAIATANHIFGFGKWGYRVLSKGREQSPDGKVWYTADIELYVLGCPFPFPGEGEGVPLNDSVEQHAKARKEAVTDALKRALRHFGDQFGLSLYNEDNYVEDASGMPVQVKDAGKSQQSNGNAPQPARKVVDSIPTPALLRSLCASVDLKWAVAQKTCFQREMPDDEMSPEQCLLLHKALLHRKEMREKSGTAGAGRE